MKSRVLEHFADRVHRPFIGVLLALGLGILGQRYFSCGFWICTCAVLMAMILSMVVHRFSRWATLCLLLAVMAGGGALVVHQQQRPFASMDVATMLRYHRKDSVMLEGRIVSDPIIKAIWRTQRTSFVLQVTRFQTPWGWRVKSGKVLVNSFRPLEGGYGDKIRIEGKLHRAFEFDQIQKFSYRQYLRRRDIDCILSVKKQGELIILERANTASLKSLALAAKHRCRIVLKRYLTSNESAIMQAILLGERTHIPRSIRDICSKAGVAHIFAISGLHIGMVAFLIFMGMKMLPLPRRVIYGLTIVLLIVYAFMTGARPSVVRATIMATIMLAGIMVERNADSLNLLALSGVVILGHNPLQLYDIGFQLSFLSVTCIIIFYPRLMRICVALGLDKMPRWLHLVAQSFSVSFAAYVGVAGLVTYYFGVISPVSLLANLMVIPLMAAIVSLGLGLLLVGLFWPGAAVAFALCLKVVLNLMVAIVFLCVKLPGAYIEVPYMSLKMVGIYYFVVGLLIIGLKMSTRLFSIKK